MTDPLHRQLDYSVPINIFENYPIIPQSYPGAIDNYRIISLRDMERAWGYETVRIWHSGYDSAICPKEIEFRNA